MKTVSIDKIIERFKLEEIVKGKNVKISVEDLHRPGLELAGFFDVFSKKRIHILGKEEIAYLKKLSKEEREKRIKEYVEKKPVCIIIARGLKEASYFKKHCEDEQVTLLRTEETTTFFMSKLNTYLKKVLSKEIGVHGVCINVFGVGILLRGKSGIGKSELALALIERGHRLISDDLVILKQIGPEVLVGTHNETNRKFLSLRGIGLINFTRIYGYGSYQEETKIELDILISPWEENTYYDAVGTEEKKVKYLDIEVKHIEIPIRPGRDLAGLIEVAARNLKLKNDGYDPLKEFQKRLEDKNEY